MLKFSGPLYVVDDLDTSRHFYEELLHQKVQFNFGVNISYEGNFAIHLKSHYQSLLGEAAEYPVTKRAHNGEMYFETDEIDAIYQQLHETGVEFIHEIREQPWAQRVMRFYDPDGHIVEIGELMDAVVIRLHRQDWSIDRIREKTGMPREYVEHVIQEQGKSG